MRHETSLTLVYDGLDGGTHQAYGWGVFGLVFPAYSRSTFSTSCLILGLVVGGLFWGRNACSGCERAG
jgi:hypothetical protein